MFVPLAAPVPTTELLLVLPKQEASKELTTLTSLIAELAGQIAKGEAGEVLASLRDAWAMKTC